MSNRARGVLCWIMLLFCLDLYRQSAVLRLIQKHATKPHKKTWPNPNPNPNPTRGRNQQPRSRIVRNPTEEDGYQEGDGKGDQEVEE